jgi:hypothetical protein
MVTLRICDARGEKNRAGEHPRSTRTRYPRATRRVTELTGKDFRIPLDSGEFSSRCPDAVGKCRPRPWPCPKGHQRWPSTSRSKSNPAASGSPNPGLPDPSNKTGTTCYPMTESHQRQGHHRPRARGPPPRSKTANSPATPASAPTRPAPASPGTPGSSAPASPPARRFSSPTTWPTTTCPSPRSVTRCGMSGGKAAGGRRSGTLTPPTSGAASPARKSSLAYFPYALKYATT